MNTAVLIPETEKELREKNMATIREYLEKAGWEKVERHPLYDYDFGGGLYTPAGPPPEFKRDKESKIGFDIWITSLFPDWTHSDLVMYQTTDPSIFLATGKGYGYVVAPEHGYPYYDNFFIHYFEVRDGKLTLYHENMNPCVMYHYFNLDVPVIKRPPRKRDYITKAVEGVK